MSMELKGKIAFITGGAQGIGKEIARVFAENGANIIIGDIKKETLENTVTELKKLKVEAAGHILDVSNL